MTDGLRGGVGGGGGRGGVAMVVEGSVAVALQHACIYRERKRGQIGPSRWADLRYRYRYRYTYSISSKCLELTLNIRNP